LLSVLFIFPSIIAGQDSPSVERWFAVTISTPKPVVKVGTAVKLKVVFINDTDEDIRYGVGGPGRSGPVFDLDVRHSEGKPVPETPHGLILHGKNPRPWSGSVYSTAAHPGDKIEEELVLNKEYDLSKPGKYTVQLRERHPKFRAVESNTIPIAIVP
jgi:hypothetical protein